MGSYTLLLLVGYSHTQAPRQEDQVDRLPVTPEDEADCVAATERINKARANYAAEEYIFAIIGPQPFSIQKYNEAMRYPIVMREYADAIENYLKTLARVYHGYVEP